jgi:hypothetical protein
MVNDMLQTNHLFKDLYDERWGDPLDPNPAGQHAANGAGHRETRLFSLPGSLTWLLPRTNPPRPNAWSFTIPIDRRLR